MTFNEMLDEDLNEVFFNVEEFGIEITHKLDDEEDENFVVIFDIKSELIIDNEIVGHQPSILVTQEIEEKIKHRSILLINGKEYNKSHTDDENVDLIRIFLERA
jgi:hypothetical protein